MRVKTSKTIDKSKNLTALPTNGGRLADAISLTPFQRENTDINPIQRNTDGLLQALEQFQVPRDELNELLLLSRMGEIGHPIWGLINEVRKSKGRIHLPGRFMLSRLKAN